MNTPNTGTIPPLYKLQAWSGPLLLMGDPELRGELIKITGNESPTQTFGIVEILMKLVCDEEGNRRFDDEEARKMAQAARWLSVLRRDYGQEEFDKLTRSRK